MHPESVLCAWRMPTSIQARIFFLPIFYLKTGEWRRQQNEELYDLYSSPDIFWVISSKRLRWVGACGTYMREWENIKCSDDET